MKKVICLILVIMVLLVGIALPVYAQGGGHGGGGHSGGGHSGGGHWDGHGGGGHRGGHSSFSGSIWIGPGWGWGGWGGWGPWWGSYPYYYPYSYPYYYSQPPVVVEERSPGYVEPAPREEEYYWYFCPESKNYYPYVKRCPGGWLKVVPRQTPPDWKE